MLCRNTLFFQVYIQIYMNSLVNFALLLPLCYVCFSYKVQKGFRFLSWCLDMRESGEEELDWGKTLRERNVTERKTGLTCISIMASFTSLLCTFSMPKREDITKFKFTVCHLSL